MGYSDAQGQAILANIYRQRGNPRRTTITEILNHYSYMPHAESTVASLLQGGYTLALISGSMDILVKHVAQQLGIKHWACNNSFIFDPEDRLERIETIEDEGDYKLHQLYALCQQLAINPRDCLCIGDGDGDVSIFKATGNGVTFKNSIISGYAAHVVDSLKDITALVHP
jgi:phosphoserine phosphatase